MYKKITYYIIFAIAKISLRSARYRAIRASTKTREAGRKLELAYKDQIFNFIYHL